MNEETEKTSSARASLWGRNFIFINLANLFIFTSFQMLTPTMPLYVGLLGAQTAMMGAVIGVFTFAAVAVRPFVGWALDTIGRRIIFIIGLIIFIVSVLLYRWATSITVLLVLRLIHGFGWGFSTTAAGTIAADAIPKTRMGEGMSFFSLSSTIAMAVGPAIGLFIVDWLGFPTLFYTCAVIAAVALPLTLGISNSKTDITPPAGKDKNTPLAAGKSAFFETSALGPTVVMLLSNTTYGAIVTFITLYAKQQGIANIGVFFAVFAGALVLSRPVIGWLVDWRGYNIVVVPGLILIAGAMVLLSQAQTLWMFLLSAAIYGVGFGAIQPSMQALALADLPVNRRGAASSTFYIGFDLGIGIGAVLWGAVSQAIQYSGMYLVAAIPAALALLIYLFTKHHRK